MTCVDWPRFTPAGVAFHHTHLFLCIILVLQYVRLVHDWFLYASLVLVRVAEGKPGVDDANFLAPLAVFLV